METFNEITERICVDYNDEEQELMADKKEIVLLQIKVKHRDGTSIIYDNQEKCSSSIVSSLRNRKIINIMITALTQSGKTGTMSALIKNYLKDNTNLIPIENVYIITGLSSCEWIEQTKNRMPEYIQERVFHRDKLTNKFVDGIKNKKNVLVIIDEIQIAAKENQTLKKTFEKAGFYDRKNLLNNDIKIIEFTATPDGTIYDLMNWGENAEKIKMEPGEGYTSCFDLKNQKRIYQCKDLCGHDPKTGEINEELVAAHILELKEVIDDYDDPSYHIIRTPNGPKGEVVINNLKKYNPLPCLTYDKDSSIKDINSILNEKPKEHTYVCIKEMMRCAKTLEKKYLGVLYERYTKTKPDDAVIIQGLIGRATGYDDNGKIKCFTNISSIEKYEKLWKSNFEDKSIKWKSKTTKKKNNELASKGTYNNPSLIDGMCVASNEEINDEPIIKKCKSIEEAKEYFNLTLKPRSGGGGPMKRKQNNAGYYETTIRNKRGVYSCSDVYKERKRGLKNTINTPFTCHPCYEDINDKSTLQFWMIHY